MVGLRPALLDVLARLKDESRDGDVISIDAIGDAVGTLPITTAEIEALFAELEKSRRKIGAPEGGNGEANLKKVVAAARALREEGAARATSTGTAAAKPTVGEIATRADLDESDVLLALALLRVMQR